MKRWYAAVLPVLAVLLATSPASATVGDLGHDLAAPQCLSGGTTTTPVGGTFGIVGVNGGTAWSENTCLQAQSAWASSLPQAPGFYANTADPAPTSSFYWPTSGSHDPALCRDATSTTDPGCAYDYGWHTAADALAKAATQSAISPTTVTWWLDVEAVNTWHGDGISNTADLQGMVDRLRAAGVPDVGIYGLAADWATISGSSALGASAYTRATSNAYRAHWPFVPSYPIEDGPVWFAGAGTSPDAQAGCGNASLTGGERLLSQYSDSGYDGDYRCADADHTAPTAAMTAPTSFVLTTTPTRVAWKGTDTGSGVASYDVQTRRAPANSGFGVWSVIGRRLLGTSVSVASPSRGTTACWSARTRDVAGNLSGWSVARCATTPLDDRDLSASSGWTRTTASGWFNRSFTSSSRYGATLTRTGLHTSRLVLLAYRCPSCGSVTVLLNGRVFKTLSLASSTAGRVQIALPRFSLRTATVALRVATSGRLVRIDGLATSRV
jgi:hypothetical protein